MTSSRTIDRRLHTEQAPEVHTVIDQIHCIDCLEGMRNIASGSVDLVLTDPPYGISYQSARRTDKAKRFKKIEGDGAPFVWFLYDAFRVLKDGGSLVCFCRWDVQEDFAKAIRWAGFNLKSQVVWDREVHGLGDLKAQFAPQHDLVWFATKGKFEFKNGRPRSIVRVSRVPAEKMIHPTEKPVELMSHFIKILTREGDIVLDPFMGSGATAVACKNANRRYIGFEIDKQFVDAANKRLSQQQLNDTKTEVFEAEALRAPPNPKGSGIRAGDRL